MCWREGKCEYCICILISLKVPSSGDGDEEEEEDDDDEEETKKSLSPAQRQIHQAELKKSSRQKRRTLTNDKQCILRIPSGRYIKGMVPGGDDPRIPHVWKTTEEHRNLLMRINYEDYLHASG